MQTLAQRVLGYIRKHELLRPGDRVGAAVSGGADSVAMLRLLLELRQEIGLILSVVHFNHKLRGAESDGDERFVAELAQCHGLEFHCQSGDVAGHAAANHVSLETAAREMRYACFRRLLGDGYLNRIATGHTLDDQAETVLMRMVRGAGTRGLAGIYPQLLLTNYSQSPVRGHRDDASIVRPLLGVRRQDLEAYLKAIGQDWREDASNLDLRYTRNRARHRILPRLEEDLNPAVRQALAETAEIARGEEEYWTQEVRRLLPDVWNGAERSLSREGLLSLPLAMRRRVIRAAAESLGLKLEFRQVEEILETGSGGAKSMELPGWTVTRQGGKLRFERAASPAATLGHATRDYEYRLPVPGAILLPEVGTRLEAVLVSEAEKCDSGNLLEARALGAELIVRNWRAGDRFWPTHRKAPRKIKELLQEKHLAAAERRLWPVILSGDEVIWVRGLAVSARFSAKNHAGPAVLIREAAL